MTPKSVSRIRRFSDSFCLGANAIESSLTQSRLAISRIGDGWPDPYASSRGASPRIDDRSELHADDGSSTGR